MPAPSNRTVPPPRCETLLNHLPPIANHGLKGYGALGLVRERRAPHDRVNQDEHLERHIAATRGPVRNRLTSIYGGAAAGEGQPTKATIERACAWVELRIGLQRRRRLPLRYRSTNIVRFSLGFLPVRV